MSRPGKTRRVVLTLAGLAALCAAVPVVRRALAPPLRFALLDDPQGFRTLQGGDVSAPLGVMAGLDAPARPVAPVRDLCAALFPVQIPGRVPVAVFSDYNCPFCRVLSEWLIAAESQGTLALSFHEMPRLGPRSDQTARLALAAAEQDAYLWFHQRFMASRFLPTEAYILALAEERGVDGPRLLRDSADMAREVSLARTDALAVRFRFPATPAMVVGRTAILGALERHVLDQVIADEARLLASLPCDARPSP